MKSTYLIRNSHTYNRNPYRGARNPHTPILIDAFNAPITVGIEYHPEWNKIQEEANMQVSACINEVIFNIGQDDKVPVE